MASVKEWAEGARLRTLPAAAAPVLAGIGGAIGWHGFTLVRSLLALLVALALQIGVNFANDYSDGIRGTDDERVGPQRLTASGAVSAKTVLYLAFACFAVAGVAGLALVILSQKWWLLLAGAAAIAAAWFYTGGKHPYGYYGVAEIFVLVFFGFMATVGTMYVQTLNAPHQIWIAGLGLGLLSCALLMINNLRDIPTDSKVGKRTLAVRIGDRNSRFLYQVYLGGAAVCGWFVTDNMWVRAVLMVWLLIAAFVSQKVNRGASGKDLLGALRNTGLLTLAFGILVAVGLALQ